MWDLPTLINNRLVRRQFMEMLVTCSFSGLKPSKNINEVNGSATHRCKATMSATIVSGPQGVNRQDMEKYVNRLIPPLIPSMYKGSAGKVAVIGGCREYTGAPYFAAMSALKVGVDLAHIFCTEPAAMVIKTYSPELIVHPYLPQEDELAVSAVDRAVELMKGQLGKFDCLVVGPGLSSHVSQTEPAKLMIREAVQRGIPLVIDADGIGIIADDPDLVRGQSKVILTPNANEVRELALLVGKRLTIKEVFAARESIVAEVARHLGGPVVVLKGSSDLVVGPTHMAAAEVEGGKRRCGGLGDVTTGSIAAFAAWAYKASVDERISIDRAVAAAYGGCDISRRAQKLAYNDRRRAMLASDVITYLPQALTHYPRAQED